MTENQIEILITTSNNGKEVYQQEETKTTIFTHVNDRFIDMKLTENGHMPTDSFIKLSHSLCTLMETYRMPTVSPYIFSLCKGELMGHVDRVKEKYLKSPVHFHTLQSIVQSELKEKTYKSAKSATNAIVWFVRSIHFFKEFMFEYACNDNREFTNAARLAYQRSLRKHHNWLVACVFDSAVGFFPRKDDIVACFSQDPDEFLNNREAFEVRVQREARTTVKLIGSLIESLDEYFKSCKHVELL